MTEANTQRHTESQNTGTLDLMRNQAAWHLDRAGVAGISLQESQYHLEQARTLGHALSAFSEARAEAFNLLGRVELDYGNRSAAAEWLEKARRLAPDHAAIAFSLGHLALQEQRLSDANTHFRQAIDIDPDATIADQSLAYVKLRSGLYAEAFADFRRLIHKYPHAPVLRTRLLDCARRVQADYDDPGLSRDVCDLLREPELDHQALAPVAGSLLVHRYQLSDPDSRVDFGRLTGDELLMTALPKLLFVHPEVEDLLTVMREALLQHLLTRGQLDEEALPAVAGLIAYGIRSEYILTVSPGEKDAVDGLRHYLSDCFSNNDIEGLSLPIALLSLYEPVTDYLTELQAANADYPLPTELRRVLVPHLQHHLQELERAEAMPRITPLEDSVSRAVRTQYEENPYPRWEYLPRYSATRYLPAVANEVPAYGVPASAPERLRILVAGTGTGRQAVHLARHFFDTEVLAVDLSRRSLAYADLQAEKLGLGNLTFAQADLLRLGDAELPPFDVIECSGVLHHMGDPMTGWRALCEQLKQGGLIKVALYSTRARRIIQALRREIDVRGLSSTPDDIRSFRQGLLERAQAPELAPLVQSVDFYSMSGVRDLLFHVQEHTFTPAELKACIDELPLDFLGFVLTPTQRRAYQHFFPKDQLMNNLDNWERLEQDNPDLFTGMYQMYLQKM